MDVAFLYKPFLNIKLGSAHGNLFGGVFFFKPTENAMGNLEILEFLFSSWLEITWTNFGGAFSLTSEYYSMGKLEILEFLFWSSFSFINYFPNPNVKSKENLGILKFEFWIWFSFECMPCKLNYKLRESLGILEFGGFGAGLLQKLLSKA